MTLVPMISWLSFYAAAADIDINGLAVKLAVGADLLECLRIEFVIRLFLVKAGLPLRRHDREPLRDRPVDDELIDDNAVKERGVAQEAGPVSGMFVGGFGGCVQASLPPGTVSLAGASR